MAIARGQITIVDLNDGKSINMYLKSNLAATQIFNTDTQAYAPDFTATNLIITPEVYVSGSDGNQASLCSSINYTINGSSNLTNYGASISNQAGGYKLTINKNLINDNFLTIEATAVYQDPDLLQNITVKSAYTITKMEAAGATIVAIAYAPEGNVFSNGEVAQLTARCDLWRGASIDDTDVSYQWYQMINGEWIASELPGNKTNTLTIPNSSVLNFETFKCEITDILTGSGTQGQKAADVISFIDNSDPYRVEITSETGTILTPALPQTTLKATVWQNEPLSDDWHTGASFSWLLYSQDGSDTEEVGNTRNITINRSQIKKRAVVTCTVTKNI